MNYFQQFQAHAYRVFLVLTVCSTLSVLSSEKRRKTEEQTEAVHTYILEHSYVAQALTTDVEALSQASSDPNQLPLSDLVGEQSLPLLQEYVSLKIQGLQERQKKRSLEKMLELIRVMDKLDLTKTALPHNGRALDRSSDLYNGLSIVCEKLKKTKHPIYLLANQTAQLPQGLDQKLVNVFVEQDADFKKWMLEQSQVTVAQVECTSQLRPILKTGIVQNSINIGMLIKKSPIRYKLRIVNPYDEQLVGCPIDLTEIPHYDEEQTYRYSEHTLSLDCTVAAFVRSCDEGSELIVFNSTDQTTWTVPFEHQLKRNSLIVSVDNNLVAFCTDPDGEINRTIHTYELSTGRFLAKHEVPIDIAYQCVISENGRYCICISPTAEFMDPALKYARIVCYLFDTRTGIVHQFYPDCSKLAMDPDTLHAWFDEAQQQLLVSTNVALHTIDLATIAQGTSCLDLYPALRYQSLSDKAGWLGNLNDRVFMLSPTEIEIAHKNSDLTICFNHGVHDLSDFDFSNDLILMSGIKHGVDYIALWNIHTLEDALQEISRLTIDQVNLLYRMYQKEINGTQYQLRNAFEQQLYQTLPAWARNLPEPHDSDQE